MRFIQHIAFLCLLIGISPQLQAQVFREVGCSPDIAPTLSLGVSQDQLVYCSGADTMCGTRINRIGGWDSVAWHPLGSGAGIQGLHGPLYAYTMHNGDMYAGGSCYIIDNKRINKIGRWDGVKWDSLGKGLDGISNGEQVNALASYKGELYIGGRIGRVDGITGIQEIARWNGSTWKNMPGVSGSLPEIRCMAVYKGELYVAGRFTMAGTTEAYNIARWDGTQWYAVGSGTGNMVNSLVVDTVRNLLYVGGYFSIVDDTIPGRIATWDGQRWYRMRDSSMFMRMGGVLSLEMYHNYLYVGGINPGGVATDTCFARWDGQQWEHISGPTGNVSSLKVYKDELYLGGSFTMIGSDSISFLARYYSPDTAEVIVGVPTIATSNTLSVYPNPTKDQLIIQSAQHFEYFEVKDLSGKVLLHIKKPKGNVVPVQALPTGVYILTAKGTDPKSYTARFVKDE
jgi:hypothetical protein